MSTGSADCQSRVELIEGPLVDSASVDQVDNVVLFIADRMRFDALPDAVANRGVSGRALAPSTFAGSSIPSLLTGRYPATHHVWEFNHQLAREPRLFRSLDNVGFNAETIWTHLAPAEKPPLRMLRASPGAPIEHLPEPFVYVEHDKGGHTPYGYSFEECESTTAFYDEHVADPADIPPLYMDGIERSCERFDRLMDTLEDRGLLDRTLVFFTADHGELLGEESHGPTSHGHPMTPEVVHVPLMVCGAGLPREKSFGELRPASTSSRHSSRLWVRRSLLSFQDWTSGGSRRHRVSIDPMSG